MPKSKVIKPRENVDTQKSERRGLSGAFETLLRRFTNLIHLAMLLPLYAFGCVLLGIAMMPGVALMRYSMAHIQALPEVLQLWVLGASAAGAYMLYGFSIIFVVPLANFIFRTHLSEWRGPYYSLASIKWYIHNGTFYLVRFTFLEFLTPTPFNILFFRMMGMKIGRGTIINSAHLSDPSLITMGEKVTIGGSATIVGHYGQGGYLVLAPVTIGNRVTIGLRATIMGGAVIGDGAKIMANSVVLPKQVIPAGETWGGVPAQRLSVASPEAKAIPISIKRAKAS